MSDQDKNAPEGVDPTWQGQQYAKTLLHYIASEGDTQEGEDKRREIRQDFTQWYHDAPYEFTAAGLIFRSYDQQYWLDEKCTGFAVGDPLDIQTGQQVQFWSMRSFGTDFTVMRRTRVMR